MTNRGLDSLVDFPEPDSPEFKELAQYVHRLMTKKGVSKS